MAGGMFRPKKVATMDKDAQESLIQREESKSVSIDVMTKKLNEVTSKIATLYTKARSKGPGFLEGNAVEKGITELYNQIAIEDSEFRKIVDNYQLGEGEEDKKIDALKVQATLLKEKAQELAGLLYTYNTEKRFGLENHQCLYKVSEATKVIMGGLSHSTTAVADKFLAKFPAAYTPPLPVYSLRTHTTS